MTRYQIDIPKWVGAITGPLGLAPGCLNYWRSQQNKALDLRLELRKTVSEVRAIVRVLPDLLGDVQLSHVKVLSRMPQGPPGEEVSPTTATAIWIDCVE